MIHQYPGDLAMSFCEADTINWGILGAARVNERLLPAIVEAANSVLTGIASRRAGAAEETLARYAPQLRGVQIYNDLDALLAADDIQAIYIPLSNHEHAEWTLKAIEHGKHVLCEKPMALSVADICAIENAARRNNVIVMEGFMYRFHPQHARVRDLIASGLIGETRLVRASFSFMMRPARMYRLAEGVSRGGGAMWDIGCYAIHSSRMFFDTPARSVTATGNFTDSGADTTTSGIIDYGEGRQTHFDFSFQCSRRSEYEVTGTKGSIKCHTVWQLPGDIPVISWSTENGCKGEEKLPPANHFRLEIEHFNDCIRTGKLPLLSLDDAKINCKIIVAALESASTGRTVMLG
jgi:predicted dehydrogenase